MTTEERITAIEVEIKIREKEEERYRKEVERRLDILNHADQRADEMSKRTVSAEVYAVQHKTVTDDVKSLLQYRDNQQGRQVIIPFAISALVSVLGILLSHYLG